MVTLHGECQCRNTGGADSIVLNLTGSDAVVPSQEIGKNFRTDVTESIAAQLQVADAKRGLQS